MHFERGFEFYWLDKHRILSQLPIKMITLLQFDVNRFGIFGFTIKKKSFELVLIAAKLLITNFTNCFFLSVQPSL